MPTAISVTLLRLSVRRSVKARSSGTAVTNSNRYHFKSVGAAPLCLSVRLGPVAGAHLGHAWVGPFPAPVCGAQGGPGAGLNCRGHGRARRRSRMVKPAQRVDAVAAGAGNMLGHRRSHGRWDKKKKFQQIPQPRQTRFTSGPADSLFHAITSHGVCICRHTLHLLYACPTATPTQGPPAPIRGFH